MFDFKYSIKKRLLGLGRLAIYAWDVCLATITHRFLSGPAPLKMLLLSDGINAHSECQFDPVLRHRRLLRNQFGLAVMRKYSNPGNVRPSRHFGNFDIVGLKFNYKSRPEEIVAAVSSVAGSKRAGSKLVYCDGNDELTMQWPGLLRICDFYWKKHAFRDLSLYRRRFRGTTNLTEYCIPDGPQGENSESGNVDAFALPGDEDLKKLFVGNSVALDFKIARLRPFLADNAGIPPFGSRPHDVVLRADVPENWMGQLRRPAAEAIAALQDSLKVLLPHDRVPPRQYAEEMLSTKICVSPFGYGEICWRDFEAIAYGCLLFKPDMGHVQAKPDIYKAHETYVPVAWDFGDLREKVEYYTEHQKESAAIVIRARTVLAEALEPEWFAGLFGRLLEVAGFGIVRKASRHT